MVKTDSLQWENSSLAAFYKKNVNYRYKGEELIFRVSQSLFSSQDIDLGTRRLLQAVVAENIPYSKVLDLGCGYGPIGISLKKTNKNAVVHMVDRDALAVEYSKLNSKENGVETSVFVSLGYDGVTATDYDLVISNIPAKVGGPILRHMLDDAKYHLTPNGTVAIVVIDAITYFIKETLVGLGVDIIFERKFPGHSVFIYKFREGITKPYPLSKSSLERDLYLRDKKIFSIKGFQLSILTAYDLPEFDTLSYETEMILNEIETIKNKDINKALLFNVNQGIIPVFISKTFKVKELKLVDRDLLALKVTKKNLLANGYNENRLSIDHQVDLKLESSNFVDCVIGTLDPKDSLNVHLMYLEQSVSLLSKGGLLVLASGSTPITRVELSTQKTKPLTKVKRQRSRGKSLIVFHKK